MANIYVRKSGNDSNSGLTPALAKLTIAGAVSIATDGDTIYFGAGLYEIDSQITSSYYMNFHGDITGEYTGDAGDVIFHGMNSSFDTYNNLTDDVFVFNNENATSFNNIIFSNIKAGSSKSLLKGNLILDNIKFLSLLINWLVVDNNGYPLNASNILCSDCSSSNIVVFGLSSNISTVLTHNLENIVIRNNGLAGGNAPQTMGIRINTINNDMTINLKNITIDNLFGSFNSVGIYSNAYSENMNTVTVNMDNVSISNCDKAVNLLPSGSAVISGNANNCNIFNCRLSPAWSNITVTGLKSVCSLIISKIPYLSINSPLLGQGNASYPSTDIEGNPRPAYGNTYGNIGAIESTSDIIQKESTIKDSGDYSVKVAPCNYFKKVFQIPVTASELRTVKVKIRIDGTWGSYRPRVSLSGQGMSLSQSTKNSTTGSFEELTVSGTPTSSGIALLTIEAHSANTDAVFYIDTITIE